MRQLAACALALLLGATASQAATTASPATPSSATKATTSTATTTSTHVKSKESCEKEAVAKKLYGQAHEDYVKECREGKK